MPCVVNWDVRANDFNRGDALILVLGTDNDRRYDLRIERGMSIEEVARRLRHLELRLLDAALVVPRGVQQREEVARRLNTAENPPSLEEGESYE
jgi:hypothetical protein